MRVFVVHVYDAADSLHDYYVRQTVEGAVRQAAVDVVTGRYGCGNPDFHEFELQRVLREVSEEPGVGRWHVRCDSWRAHVDEMEVPEETPAVDHKDGKLTADYASLQRLYAESRDYVDTLERERDALVETMRRNTSEIDRLDAEVEALRRQVGQ